MDNWVLIPCHNNSALLIDAIDSVLAQTIPVRIFAINNASKDNTPFVLKSLSNKHIVVSFNPQLGVAGAWNFGLNYLFNKEKVGQVLVVNQDIILRPDTYETLLAENADFVTAVSTQNSSSSALCGQYRRSRRPHPDFACFLIQKGCYQRTGQFDETYFPAWYEDNDMHIRMAKVGIEAYCIDLPFYHYAAGTMKNASKEDLTDVYNPGFLRSKQYFYDKWGVLPGTKEYEEMCSPTYWAA